MTSTALTTSQTSTYPALPVVADVETARVLDWCRSGASRREDGKLALLNPPSPRQRDLLARRHKALGVALLGHDRRMIAKAVSEMLDCYRNALKPGEDAKNVTAKYVQELAGLATWACVRACFAVRMGEAPGVSLQFAPSTIQLRVVASSYVAPWLREATEIFEVLQAGKAAPEVTGEQRDKVGKLLAGLADEMRGRTASERQETAPAAGPSDEQLQAHYGVRQVAPDDVPTGNENPAFGMEEAL